VTPKSTAEKIEALFPEEKYYGSMWEYAKQQIKRLVELEREAAIREASESIDVMASFICCNQHNCPRVEAVKKEILKLIEKR